MSTVALQTQISASCKNVLATYTVKIKQIICEFSCMVNGMASIWCYKYYQYILIIYAIKLYSSDVAYVHELLV